MVTVMMVAEKPSICNAIATALSGGKHETHGRTPPVHTFRSNFRGQSANIKVEKIQCWARQGQCVCMERETVYVCENVRVGWTRPRVQRSARTQEHGGIAVCVFTRSCRLLAVIAKD